MLNLIELEQFVAFSDYGTLSKAAEHLNISQPTITRSMQHVEDAFGVPLFIREKTGSHLVPPEKRRSHASGFSWPQPGIRSIRYSAITKASIPLLLNPVPPHPCGPYSRSYPPIILTCPFHPVSRILTIS